MFSFLKWIRTQIAQSVAAGIEDGVSDGIKRVTQGTCVLDVEPEPMQLPPVQPSTATTNGNGRARKATAAGG